MPAQHYTVTAIRTPSNRHCNAEVDIMPPLPNELFHKVAGAALHELRKQASSRPVLSEQSHQSPSASVITFNEVHRNCEQLGFTSHAPDLERMAAEAVIAGLGQHGLSGTYAAA